MNSAILYDQKWHKLIQRSFLFRYFPFVDFVLAAGSMALGDVHVNSDFDVIVGAKYGRLYTARFCCLFFYRLIGWRRGLAATKDGFCFNHFVTEQSYSLQPPHNLYWRELYANLAPIFGNDQVIKKFFLANQWADFHKSDEQIFHDLRFQYKKPSRLKIFVEWLLAGRLGDLLEKAFEGYQLKKINQFLQAAPLGYKPRLIFSDKEVEMHLDTRRLETIKNKRYV